MHSLLVLLLQITVILIASRAVGIAFRAIRQPQVVGEMVAGILLGPSLLGWVAPGVSAFVFPPESLGQLAMLSQVGLLLFMFLVGLELDPELMRGRGHAAVVTSHVSIVAPFLLGSVLALHLYPRLSDSSVGFTGFALFMGAAMSVTAFPVLARILQERNLVRTRVGALAIACAAVDDVTAWAILAVVVVVVRAQAAETPLWITLAGTTVYIAVVLAVLRPALRLIERRYARAGRLSHDVMALVLLAVLVSAWTTERLGVHALFGAFCVGAVMPKHPGLVRDLTDRLEHVTVVLLLPLFFASAGLRTRIGLVSGAEMWGFFGLVMLVAVAGKLGGSSIAARLTGHSWRESAAVGVLMNTRGLMELVILTIGLDLGVISPALFAMMVMMALVTTFMTTPILDWIHPSAKPAEDPRESEDPDAWRVLVPVSVPASGPGLLRVAESLVPPGRPLRVYAVHLREEDEHGIGGLRAEDLPHDELALQPLLREAEKRALDVRAVVLASQQPGPDIAELAAAKRADLVLMGWHKPVVVDHPLGGVVQEVLERATCDVAVYAERAPAPWKRMLVPYRHPPHDDVALAAARAISSARGLPLTVLKVVEPEGDFGATMSSLVDALAPSTDESRRGEHVDVKVVRSDDPVAAVVDEVRQVGHDLVVIGVAAAWGLTPSFIGFRHQGLARATRANLLVVRPPVASPRTADAPADAAPSGEALAT